MNLETSTSKPSSEIGPEHSLPAQIRLMTFMIPSELRDLVKKSDGQEVSNEDEIFFAWNEYFSNDFREFWDTEPDLLENQARLARVQEETTDNPALSEDDLAKIVATFSTGKKELFIEKIREILLEEIEREDAEALA